MYEALRKDGASQEKAARISNAAAATSRHQIGKRGGNADAYEEWTRDALRRRASDLGIQGHSKMTKAELIKALRSH